jgi:hypothetical protein
MRSAPCLSFNHLCVNFQATYHHVPVVARCAEPVIRVAQSGDQGAGRYVAERDHGGQLKYFRCIHMSISIQFSLTFRAAILLIEIILTNTATSSVVFIVLLSGHQPP